MLRFAYTDAQRIALIADLPFRDRSAEIVSDLEAAASEYLEHKKHRPRRDPKAARERYNDLSKVIAPAAAALAFADDADLWRGIHRSVFLHQFAEIVARAAAFAEANDSLVTAYSGRRHPFRDALYERVILTWTAAGGELRMSRTTQDGKPAGPILRYLQAALGPIMGDATPGPEGIAKIVGKSAQKRDYHEFCRVETAAGRKPMSFTKWLARRTLRRK